MESSAGVGDTKLHDDADANSNLVGSKYLLAFDGKFSFTDIYEDNFDPGTPIKTEIEVPRDYIASRVEDTLENSVFIPKATVSWFNDYNAISR